LTIARTARAAGGVRMLPPKRDALRCQPQSDNRDVKVFHRAAHILPAQSDVLPRGADSSVGEFGAYCAF